MKNEFFPDEQLDQIGQALQAIRGMKAGTKQREVARKELIEKLKDEGYDIFRGRHESLPIGRVGDSALVSVRSGKGGLARYRGSTIRLAIAGRGKGSNGRIFAAKSLD